MRYRITIESQDPDTQEFSGKVAVEFDCTYTLDADLVDWVREEIDPEVTVSAPGMDE